jgi:E3 ubiquitin-protein ligase RNF216
MPTEFLVRDLKAAESRRLAQEKKQAAEKPARERTKAAREAENLRRAQQTGQMDECCLCTEDVPLNRLVSCHGKVVHKTCWSCVVRNTAVQIGNSTCKLECTPMGQNCGAAFPERKLQEILDGKMYKRLCDLQSKAVMREVIMKDPDGYAECPFCGTIGATSSIGANQEFWCPAVDCSKLVCRLCNKRGHKPLTCAEATKDEKLSIRHLIEEAMTEATIRSCNTCKVKFIKSEGCNAMHCTNCGKSQCYLCGETILDHQHFFQGPCQLYSNHHEMHQKEAEDARRAAVVRVREKYPQITNEDVKIAFSENTREDDWANRERTRLVNTGMPLQHAQFHLQRNLENRRRQRQQQQQPSYSIQQ